ncbi:unnamed protein product [Choristocarpus tenellus]
MEKSRRRTENVLKEASVMRYLGDEVTHPNVMTVVDCLRSRTCILTVTNFYEGGDLLSRINLGMDISDTRRWGRDILSGLRHMHHKVRMEGLSIGAFVVSDGVVALKMCQQLVLAVCGSSGGGLEEKTGGLFVVMTQNRYTQMTSK